MISPTASREALSIVDRFLTAGTELLLQAFLHDAAVLQPLSSHQDWGQRSNREGPACLLSSGWISANINLEPSVRILGWPWGALLLQLSSSGQGAFIIIPSLVGSIEVRPRPETSQNNKSLAPHLSFYFRIVLLYREGQDLNFPPDFSIWYHKCIS